MDRFVGRLNIEHYFVRLRTEADAPTRALLHRLLREEEDRLGSDLEHLAALEQEIAGANGRITRQQERVQHLESNGQDAGRAKILLQMFRQTLELYEQRRRFLLGDIEANGLLKTPPAKPGRHS